MTQVIKATTIGAFALALVLAFSVPTNAYAGHEPVELTVGKVEACGEVTFSTEWGGPTHQVANTLLVVKADGEQFTAPIGEEITVGPFKTSTATIEYRIWGGGERDYDNPAVDLPVLLDYMVNASGSPLDMDAPGISWHTLEVDGCKVTNKYNFYLAVETFGNAFVDQNLNADTIPESDTGLRMYDIVGNPFLNIAMLAYHHAYTDGYGPSPWYELTEKQQVWIMENYNAIASYEFAE